MNNFSIQLIWAKIQIAITALGRMAWLFLGRHGWAEVPLPQMTVLIVFVVLDYVTGVMCAIIDKKLSSEIGFRGIFKKVLIFLLVGVANIVDVHVIGTGAAIRGAVICFYLSNEGVSILENAAHIGLPVPEKLKAVLEQLHNRGAKEIEDSEKIDVKTKDESEYGNADKNSEDGDSDE